ncbi:MAG: ORF6N domain-containing protein, partial [Planctomycetota bacterium]
MLSEMTLTIEHTLYPVLTLPYRPKALLDRTVAEIYGVPTKQVNQAVSRNLQRFPEDFYFELNR